MTRTPRGTWGAFNPDTYDRHREEALHAAEQAVRQRYGSLWGRKRVREPADPLVNAHVITTALDAAARRLHELHDADEPAE